MNALLPRLLMAIADASLSFHRREWAMAMRAEFEEAAADGRSLSFSVGCLLAAWRELPAHSQGRVFLAGYILALGIILPFAAMLLAGAMTGYPFVDVSSLPQIQTPVPGKGMPPLVNEGNRLLVPGLAFLIVLLAARHVLTAWFVVEGDWERTAAVQRFGAALLVTLALFASVIMIDWTCIILPFATLATELLLIRTLTQWHEEILPGAGQFEG